MFFCLPKKGDPDDFIDENNLVTEMGQLAMQISAREIAFRNR